MGVLIYVRDRQLNSVGANGVSIRVSLLQNQNNTTDSPQILTTAWRRTWIILHSQQDRASCCLGAGGKSDAIFCNRITPSAEICILSPSQTFLANSQTILVKLNYGVYYRSRE